MKKLISGSNINNTKLRTKLTLSIYNYPIFLLVLKYK